MHGISASAVSRIVKEFKSDKEAFGPILRARQAKAQRKQLIKDAITEKLQVFSFIDSSDYIAKELSQRGICKTTASEVRGVLRDQMMLRYRTVKPVNPHCNSERCLVLRQ
jgi:hypothetical protein